MHRVGGLDWINLALDKDKWPAICCDSGSTASWPNDDGEIPECLVTLDSAPCILMCVGPCIIVVTEE